jgi:hypothetical protein
MVILRVGDVPLALCMLYSKRRAILEKHKQVTDFKDVYMKTKEPSQGRTARFCRSRNGKAASLACRFVQSALINAG